VTKWTPKAFDIVEICALDHTEERKPYEFVCYGRIAKVAPDYYLLESWTHPTKHGTARGFKSNHVGGYSIIRSAIIKITKLNRSASNATE